MSLIDRKLSILYTGILLLYIATVIYCAVISREPKAHGSIQRVFLWGYERNYIEVISYDNLINLIVFIPIGVLTCLISSKYRVVKALLVGLFVSETVECAQLIWKRGVFDVDDLINNTFGALIGGLLGVFVWGKWTSKN